MSFGSLFLSGFQGLFIVVNLPKRCLKKVVLSASVLFSHILVPSRMFGHDSWGGCTSVLLHSLWYRLYSVGLLVSAFWKCLFSSHLSRQFGVLYSSVSGAYQSRLSITLALIPRQLFYAHLLLCSSCCFRFLLIVELWHC